MSNSTITSPPWLNEWMRQQEIVLWGAADLQSFSTPQDETERGFPFALSWAIPMNPQIMVSIQNGPNQAYADEYARVNNHINQLSVALAAKIKARGFRAKPLAASDRTDTINIKGDFPHKTAATRAGLGWVGRHCQLITRPFGSWIRLGTVFTDIELPCGPPMERNFCGRCMRCVEACPARALKGSAWYPGVSREEIMDVLACDRWKKEHYYQFHKGHICGVCSAICPYGLKFLKKKSEKTTSVWDQNVGPLGGRNACQKEIAGDYSGIW
jgi:epoxyqueuosine reductase